MDDEGSEIPINPLKQRLSSKRDAMRMDRISRRLNWITGLMPILMVLPIVLGYTIVKQRLRAIQDEGVAKIQSMAEGLEKKFADLEDRYEKMKQAAAERDAPLMEAFMQFEKTSATISDETESLKARLEKMDGTKADQASVDVFNQKLKALQDEKIQPLLTTIEKQTQGLQETREALKPVIEAMNKLQTDTIPEIRKTASASDARFKALSAADEDLVPDMAAMRTELAQVKKSLLEALEVVQNATGQKQTDSGHAEKLDELRRQVSRLEKAHSDHIARYEAAQAQLKLEIQDLKGRAQMGVPGKGQILEQPIHQ